MQSDAVCSWSNRLVALALGPDALLVQLIEHCAAMYFRPLVQRPRPLGCAELLPPQVSSMTAPGIYVAIARTFQCTTLTVGATLSPIGHENPLRGET